MDSFVVNTISLGYIHHAFCAVERRAGRELTAGGEDKTTTLCHRVDLITADLVPFLVLSLIHIFTSPGRFSIVT